MTNIIIHLIVAARPNFMKVAPLYHALCKEGWCTPVLIHTGQHYNSNMSDTFFRDLNLPNPDWHLGVGSGTHAEQTAGVMIAYEKVCQKQRPDWVIVVGDVNSTMACAITAKKLNLKVAHLEAGLRSRDMSMPEEINRLITDAISDLLWTPSPDADENLLREGIPETKIVRVGNIMIDSLEMLRSKIDSENASAAFGLTPGSFGVVTLHRPVNVDDLDHLKIIVLSLIEISEKLPLIFPVHPRTRSRLKEIGIYSVLKTAHNLHLTEPQTYIHFMSLVMNARLVITDSGGVQEETTYLNIPCLTLRENTERPITILHGTNRLVNIDTLVKTVVSVISAKKNINSPIEFWDGHTAGRIVQNLKEASIE
jgi:UDP-N-acetylglucosamine 2-epimerase (non-hydrolysing)